MYEDPFHHMLESLYLLLTPVAILLVISLAFNSKADSNPKFKPGEKAFCAFSSDTVMIQAKVSSLMHQKMYRVLYKTKNGLLLSADVPADNLTKLAIKGQKK